VGTRHRRTPHVSTTATAPLTPCSDGSGRSCCSTRLVCRRRCSRQCAHPVTSGTPTATRLPTRWPHLASGGSEHLWNRTTVAACSHTTQSTGAPQGRAPSLPHPLWRKPRPETLWLQCVIISMLLNQAANRGVRAPVVQQLAPLGEGDHEQRTTRRSLGAQALPRA